VSTGKVAKSRHQDVLGDIISVPPQVEDADFLRQRTRGKSRRWTSHAIRTIKIDRVGRVQNMTK
jgi:hypothetical protein